VQRLRKVIACGAYKSEGMDNLIHAGMSAQEAEMFKQFTDMVRTAATDPAITSGATYDLNYCNVSSDGFNKDKHYAFLRNYKGRTLLIAANFSGNDADVKLTIPSHAFDWMNIVRSKTLYPGKSIKVQIPAKKAAIIELI
jgi:hypothetical protein